MRTLVADIRYGCRVLLRTPSFTIAVVAVLALGIGANTAIFSIVNSVLLRPLPFEAPAQVVRLFHVPPQDAFPGMPTFSVSPANFYDWQRDATSFEGMSIYRFRQFTMTGSTAPRAVIAGAVSAGFFQLLHAKPAIGRVFLDEEDQPGRSRVVILSDRFWRSQFGAASDITNRTLTLDGEVYSIVGVMPSSFSLAAWGLTAREVWVPVAYTDAQRAVRENHNAQVVARLKPGVDVSRADSEMRTISTRLEQAYPKDNAGWSATVIPLQEVIVGDIRMSLVMLLGAVGLVLIIACANVGNLLFARVLSRRKELAIRAALGAGRGRVFQQLLVESLLLAAAGGVAGLLLARVALSSAATLLVDQLPRAEEISIDGRVLLFAAATSIVTGILAGVLPAIRSGRADLTDSLKEGGRSETGSVGLNTRRLLIVCEVALSLVLLMGAAVMIRSLVALRHVDTGFDLRSVLTMNVSLPQRRYETAATVSAFFTTTLDRLRALPGVDAVGAIDNLPLQGGSVQAIVLEGKPELLPREQPTVEVRKITPGYLTAMNIPLVRGRDVAPGDVEVMLISQSAAKMLWGDDDPIGRRVTLPLQSRTTFKEVIGIVGDVKQGELSAVAAATVYEYTREHSFRDLAVVMKTSVPPLTLAQAATAAIRSIDPQQPVEQIRTMDDLVDEMLASQRFSTLLLGLFAVVALTLASVGIYSVLSYIVRGRSREIGIRTALGARTADVLRLVIVEGMTPALAGIVAGVIGALAAARLLRTLVFGVSASDPLTLAAVAAGLALIALVACLVPAYRASKLNPLDALRSN